MFEQTPLEQIDMSKIEIEVSLSDEDRALLRAVKTGLSGASGKAKQKPAEDSADEFEDVDGDGDTGDEADTGEDDGDTGDDTAEKPTRDDVRAVLKAYAKAVGSQAAAIKLMKAVGGSDSLSNLKESKFAAVIAKAKEKTKGASK